jgi:hypothetical protein
MMARSPVAGIFVGVLYALLAAAMLVGGYWMFFDDKVPAYQSYAAWFNHSNVPTEQFRAGDTAYIARTVCGTREMPVSTGKRLVRWDGTIYILPTSEGRLELGCRKMILAVPLPVVLRPGKYEYQAMMRYSNNPLRDSSYTFPTPLIEIVP